MFLIYLYLFKVWKLQPGARIVAAAPSNAAADLLAERLKVYR